LASALGVLSLFNVPDLFQVNAINTAIVFFCKIVYQTVPKAGGCKRWKSIPHTQAAVVIMSDLLCQSPLKSHFT